MSDGTNPVAIISDVLADESVYHVDDTARAVIDGLNAAGFTVARMAPRDDVFVHRGDTVHVNGQTVGDGDAYRLPCGPLGGSDDEPLWMVTDG